VTGVQTCALPILLERTKEKTMQIIDKYFNDLSDTQHRQFAQLD